MKPLLGLCVFGLASAFAASPCATVDRDRILASDIAPHLSLFAQVDADTVVSLAPVPGSHRTFSGGELRSIAKRSGITIGEVVPALCFERAVAPLTPERIQRAMLATLETTTMRIRVVDFSHLPVPSGELEFARAGLEIPSPLHRAEPALWRGTVRYSPQHTIAVWALVRIEEERPVVLAVRELHAGNTIAPADIVVSRRTIFALEPHLENGSNVIGRAARRTIPAGAFISEDLIEIPPDIAPGQTVHVTASRGLARIVFDAVARSGGTKGDSILLVNPESHRGFRAVVDGKGEAHVGPEDRTL